MLSFECIKNEKSVYFLLTSALLRSDVDVLVRPDTKNWTRLSTCPTFIFVNLM